jgi:multidrug transporter EmrE-like cation transporter
VKVARKLSGEKERYTMAAALAILLIAIALGAVGQMFLKSGVTVVKEKYAAEAGVALVEVENDVPGGYIVKSLLTTPLILVGFFCYAVSSMFYLMSLNKLDLSYAYPLIALSYVIVVVLSWKYLGEDLPPLRIVGLAVVLIGVFLLGISYPKASAAKTEAVSPAIETPADSGGGPAP